MKRYLITVLILSLFGCNRISNSKISSDKLSDTLKIDNNWVFDKVVGSKLAFKNGKTFETKLYELQYVGQIPVENKAPFLIFSGRECNECDANISIYIHSPSDGLLDVYHGQNRYEYPGTVKDYETDSLLSISRAFYGQISEKNKGVIWYENRLLVNGKMGRSIFLAYIYKGKLKDTLYYDKDEFDLTINYTKKGLCKEIAGRNFTSEP